MASSGNQLTLLELAREKRRQEDGKSMWDWSGDNDLYYGPDYTAKATKEDAIVIECWKYEDENTPHAPAVMEQEVKYIKTDDIAAWLERPCLSRSGRRLCAGIRLIQWSQSELYSSPFQERTIAIINDKFGLPPLNLHRQSEHTGACGRSTSGNSNVIFWCRRAIDRPFISSILRHDYRTGITVGLIESEDMLNIHCALLGIPEQFRDHDHPLLIPLLMMEMMLKATTQDYMHISSEVEDVETTTGFHSMEEGIDERPNTDPDYRQVAKRLGKAASLYAFGRSRALILKLVNEFCLRHLKSSESWIPEDKWQNYKEATARLVERCEFDASHIEHLLVYRGIEMRLQAQQNVIFNLIAQEDNRTNIRLSDEMRRIAAKTKQDGSIMKVIAFLGTFFLPATFVSTLFAMPLFKWDAPTLGEVASDHFWVYWAVTGPLTVLTMTIVGYWILSRTQKNQDDKDLTKEQEPSRLTRLNEKLDFRRKKSPIVPNQV